MPKWSRAHACAPLTILLALFSLSAFPQAPRCEDAGHQKLNSLKPQKVKLKATGAIAGDERVVTVRITNKGKEAILGAKLTLVDHLGVSIEPATYSDNNLTVLPGEPRTVEIRYPANLDTRATVQVRGWNVQETSARVAGDGITTYAPYYPQPWQQPATTPAPTVKSATVTLPQR